MKIASLSEVKNELSRFIERVRQGERVRILVRGVPVADLVPVPTSGETDDLPERLAELERRGLLRRGRSDIAPELLKPGPSAKGRALSELVLEERRSNR